MEAHKVDLNPKIQSNSMSEALVNAPVANQNKALRRNSEFFNVLQGNFLTKLSPFCLLRKKVWWWTKSLSGQKRSSRSLSQQHQQQTKVEITPGMSNVKSFEWSIWIMHFLWMAVWCTRNNETYGRILNVSNNTDLRFVRYVF